MRRDGPERINVPLDPTQIHAITIGIIDVANRALFHQFANLPDGGVVLERMPDHEYPLLALRQCNQLSCFRGGHGERFFDQHVLAMFERGAGNGKMSARRG